MMETKSARLTILIDPAKKAAFEELCAAQDLLSVSGLRRKALFRGAVEEDPCHAHSLESPQSGC